MSVKFRHWMGGGIQCNDSIIVLAILFASVLPVSVLVPSAVGSAVVMLLYALLFALLVSPALDSPRGFVRQMLSYQSEISRVAIVAWVVLSSLHVLQIALGNYQTTTNAISAVVTPVIVAMNLFVMPRLMPATKFFSYVAWVCAVLVSVGLPAYAYGLLLSPGQVEAFLWQSSIHLPLVEIPVLSSVTDNPNILGRIAFVGAVAALYFSLERGARSDWVALSLNSLGLFLSYSQTSWFVFLLVVGLLTVFSVLGREWLRASIGIVIAGVLGGVVFLYFVVGPMVGMTLSGRLPLWEATVRTISEQPLLGHGFGSSGEMIDHYTVQPEIDGHGTHNAYLYMALTTGIVGGLTYIGLYTWSIVSGLRQRQIDIVPLATVFGFGIIQITETANMFGYTAISIIIAISIGYLLTPSRA